MLALILAALASVNVNTAPSDSLDALPGVGPVIVQRIIEERKEKPFKTCEDVQSRVRGIGDKKITQICPKLEF